jgi:hypothetical protein
MPTQRYWNDEPRARPPTNARELFFLLRPGGPFT